MASFVVVLPRAEMIHQPQLPALKNEEENHQTSFGARPKIQGVPVTHSINQVIQQSHAVLMKVKKSSCPAPQLCSGDNITPIIPHQHLSSSPCLVPSPTLLRESGHVIEYVCGIC